MECVRSDLACAAGEASAAAAVPDLEASAGVVMGKKNRAFPRAAGTVRISAWTGQKKTKIQGTPTSGENSSSKVVGGKELEREEIEGFDFDDDKLAKEVRCCLGRLKDVPYVYYNDAIDDESFAFFDEEQLKVLNKRLALCRIRAHEEEYQDMDEKTLSELFTSDNFEANEYYLDYELSFDWYFDPVYCQYAEFQDYQRLMLRNNGEYEDWEFYRRTCSTLEGDQEFVRFWEELSSKTELIEWYITRRTGELKFERLFYYHTLKIAAAYPNVYRALICQGFIEFKERVQIDFIWRRPYFDFLFEMWKLLTGEQKLSFKDALKRLYNDDKYSLIFAIKAEFEPNLQRLEKLFKPFLDSIGEKEVEKAKGLIRNYGSRPKTYYDYAKKKLAIAEKIGLISSPPQKPHVTEQFMDTP